MSYEHEKMEKNIQKLLFEQPTATATARNTFAMATDKK